MKPGTVLAATLLLGVAIAATFWIARPGTGATTAAKPAADAASDEEANQPKPSPTGPHPKIVIPEPEFAFGVMQVNETRTHAFVIRNEGEAPLRVGKAWTTCKCTISDDLKDAIPPGAESTVTLEWTPKEVSSEFRQVARMKTNDPKSPEVEVVVSGGVAELVNVEPAGSWQVGEIVGDKPTPLTGYVYSKILDSFGIESVAAENPALTGEAVPMSPEKLAEYKAKSGYELKVTLAPGIPIGRFNERLSVKTDLGDEKFTNLTFQVTGTRRGPITFLPLPGVKWQSDSMAVDLGRFPSAKGKSATVQMFVAGLPEGQDLRFESVEVGVPYVGVSLEKDAEFKGTNRQRYLVTFEYPPGGPATTRRAKSAVKVDVRTNHPDAAEMKFFVELLAVPGDA